MSRIKVRQHVNPLSRKYQTAIEPPDWQAVYRDLDLPIHLDIGCAWGRFLLKLAPEDLTWNYLGIEIREPLVIEANRLRDEASLTNLHYLFANINTSIESILASLPAGKLQRVSIQYPDPCFKTKHAKRRMVQPQIVTEIDKYLAPEGIVFLQSDLEWVAQEMCDRFDLHPNFNRDRSEWLPVNPLGIPTERETATLNKGLPVFRAIYHHRITA
jgi:tRNA (guanine-N7-)-methyltransferase